MEFEITREIGIDAGHRVTYHDSKCRNVHGHRYTIQATCRGPLVTQGASEGMVMDFGFLKELMVQFIDANCDHGLILWSQDPLTREFLPLPTYQQALKSVEQFGATLQQGLCGKLYIVPFVPTAEQLAKHWFDLLKERVAMRSQGNARLVRLRVWETPNSFADYPCELS